MKILITTRGEETQMKPQGLLLHQVSSQKRQKHKNHYVASWSKAEIVLWKLVSYKIGNLFRSLVLKDCEGWRVSAYQRYGY